MKVFNISMDGPSVAIGGYNKNCLSRDVVGIYGVGAGRCPYIFFILQ